MLWSDIYPYVLPNVTGCPDPLLDLHIRQAAIEFCRRTLCDKRTLDPITIYYVDAVVELDLPSQTQPVKLLNVTVNDLECTVVDTSAGRQAINQASNQTFCFTTDKKTLTFNPVLPLSDVVTATMALAPSYTATSINTDVASPYMQDIAFGALATLHMMPGQAWSDASLSAANRALFSQRIATIAAHFSRGQASVKMRNFKTYF